MTRVVRVVGGIAPDVLARHAPAIGLDTFEDVLRWGGDVLEVFVQDEYTHDVVVMPMDFSSSTRPDSAA